MKFSSAIIAAVLAFATLVSAKPGGSPLCDTTGAGPKIAASPMGANQKNLATENAFAFTSSVDTYTPSESITISMAGSVGFNGILMYFAPSSDLTKRVGKWTVPEGFKANSAVCQNSEFDESSLTHTAGQSYSQNMDFTFEAPASDMGDIVLNVIIMAPEGTGYAWGVWPTALTIKNGGSDVAATTPTEEAAAIVESTTICPAMATATVLRKCKPKGEFITTIKEMHTQMVTVTETSTTTMKETETVTSTETETVSPTCEAVAGDEASATETTMMHEETTTTMMHEETTTPMMHEETTTMMHEETTAAYDNSYGSY